MSKLVSADVSGVVRGAAEGPRAGVRLGVGVPRAAVLAVGLSVAGIFAVYSTAIVLWGLWLNDPLKSIGGLVPVVSLILILRAWKSLGWEMDGTWWGLAILAVTVAVVHLRDHAIMELILSPSWSIFVPPHSLVALLYTAGAVLLFGGWRLLRAARFPVLLMWLVNPVPNFFTIHIDLPLQHLSSGIARGFAHAMGQKLTPDQLRLMFTPEFGMFIAPGCNGIRGAVTMGMIALIAGYLYRFKPGVTAALVAGAVLLGYVFNLVRLCFLVLFYITALHIPWLQSRAEMGDYVIGACLFFFATAVLFTLIQRLSPGGSLRPPPLPQVEARVDRRVVGPGFGARSFGLRWVAFAVLIAVGSVTYVRALTDKHVRSAVATGESDQPPFPEWVGRYKLQRVWAERLTTGTLVFYWADYAPGAVGGVVDGHTPDGGEARDGDSGVVSVGISPTMGAHDTLICHAARGEDWLWHGDLALGTEDGPTNLSGSFFNNGATQYMEATTVCSGETCGQYNTNGGRRFGFVYSRPDARSVLGQSPTRPIPVLLRTETLNTSMASDAARMELTDNLRAFLAGAKLAEFTKPYREP